MYVKRESWHIKPDGQVNVLPGVAVIDNGTTPNTLSIPTVITTPKAANPMVVALLNRLDPTYLYASMAKKAASAASVAGHM